MANLQVLAMTYLSLLASFLTNCHSQEKKVYVVYMGEKSKANFSEASIQDSLHYPILESILGSTVAAKESLIYSYQRSFNGFAAKLSEEEFARISEIEGVISIMPNTLLQLYTTRSWDFMGFTLSQVEDYSDINGGDVIIGMIDSGIWPESSSFNDEGFSPPPARWRGTCETNSNFTCNNKIIGARYYYDKYYHEYSDFSSPRDSMGHGTHIASIAAGRRVEGANFYGQAKGLARGGAPNARIAVYKACSRFGCSLADILAAFDDAIADGVDIISVSFGTPTDGFQYDPVAIGSFHALRKGVLTITAAGNSGPARATVTNWAPWMLTVAASNTDRKFISKLLLGDGQVFNGIGINSFDLHGKLFPLIWGGDATNYSANGYSELSKDCYSGALDTNKTKGKIVLCEQRSTGSSILTANGVGVIMPIQSFGEPAFPFPLPATLLTEHEIVKVLDYLKSAKKPVATILVSEVWGNDMAPYIAPFSSRGPNWVIPDILKPDITAPGMDILAAWSPVAPTSIDDIDHRRTKYYIHSGTSMACPHVTGAAAHVKAAHPRWSPSAIKSALMTTAFPMDPKKHENEREFAYGSGLLNPKKAVNPGLVFDMSNTDYVDFLCKQGYNTTMLRLITGDESVCQSNKPGRGWDLNYPSFSLAIADGQKIKGSFNRIVTNVGSPTSTYHANVTMCDSINVKVEPSVLSFTSVGEKHSFVVKVNGPRITQLPLITCSITWKDGMHVVRTPLVVYTVLPSKLSPSKEAS